MAKDKGSNRKQMQATHNTQAEKEKDALFSFLTGGKKRNIENVAHGASLFSSGADKSQAPDMVRDMFAEEEEKFNNPDKKFDPSVFYKNITKKQNEFNETNYDVSLAGVKKRPKPKPMKASAPSVTNAAKASEETTSKKTLLGA
jgi:hypothetical protein